MIERKIVKYVQKMATLYPIVTVTGPRQSGKTTMLKEIFPEYKYVSLENPDTLEFALDDPRGFLISLNNKAIIDEAQKAPQLFSYLQGVVDDINEPGMFILSGSQNFLLMESISQSLSGRVAIVTLLPFCYSELKKTDQMPENENRWILNGGYPRLYDMKIQPKEYYPNYISTYVERDVRQIKNITSTVDFTKFMRLCAARVGSVLNISALANEAEISTKTAKEWLSVLESSYILFQCSPYFSNGKKRITKSPKLYFYDVGLACSLLDIYDDSYLALHPKKGELFENMVICEFLKEGYANGNRLQPNFWRASETQEVDLIIDSGISDKIAIEIKSSHTWKPKFSKTLREFAIDYNYELSQTFVVYAGEEELIFKDIKHIPYTLISKRFDL